MCVLPFGGDKSLSIRAISFLGLFFFLKASLFWFFALSRKILSAYIKKIQLNKGDTPHSHSCFQMLYYIPLSRILQDQILKSFPPVSKYQQRQILPMKANTSPSSCFHSLWPKFAIFILKIHSL